MSERKDDIHQVSMEDIRRYLQGDLTPAEMHVVEKAALDDPFIADALEGMELTLKQHEEGAFERDHTELLSRLNRRVAEQDERVLSGPGVWWRVAAATLLITGGLAITLNMPEKRMGQSSVLNLKEEETADRKPGSLSASPAKTNNAVNLSKPAPGAASEKTASAAETQAPKGTTRKAVAGQGMGDKDNRANVTPVPTDRQAASVETVADEKISGDPAAVDKSEAPEMTRADNQVSEKLQGRAAGIIVSRSPARATDRIKGRVVDRNGQPVSDAVVEAVGQNVSVTTDSNGGFDMSLQRTDTAVVIAVYSIGYKSVSLPLGVRDSGEKIVVLSPSNEAVSEVVVAGYGKPKKNRGESKVNGALSNGGNRNIMPVGGWNKFNEYIEVNKEKLNVDSTIHGTQIISFLIDPQGKPGTVTVEKSLSRLHDKETVRLIQDGPSWRMLKGKNRKVRLTVVF